MDVIIIVAGILGIGVAGYALLALAVDALRQRQTIDIALAVAVAVLTVWALLAFGDRLLK